MPEPSSVPLVRSLPAPRPVELEVSETLVEAGGFLRRISRLLRVVGDHLSLEVRAPFRYDEVDRRALDAVVVVPHFRARDGASGHEERWVVLRSAPRPPVLLRDPERFSGQLGGRAPLWEVPAGLVEAEEEHDLGLRQAAARELEEETGFVMQPHELRPLGPSTYPSPGVIAERQYFFEADVTFAEQAVPGLDGSPLEALGELVAVPLAIALTELGRNGPVDAKTELALRRLLEAHEIS